MHSINISMLTHDECHPVKCFHQHEEDKILLTVEGIVLLVTLELISPKWVIGDSDRAKKVS